MKRYIFTSLVFLMALTIILSFLFVTNNTTYLSSFTQKYIPVASTGETYRWGSRGEMVKKIQRVLKNAGAYTGSIDGVFGYQTYMAVRKYQSWLGLTVDGVVGAKTLEAMGIQASSGGSYSNRDKYLLACAIYGEARGESYTGQVAVGAVILNRVRSSKFPNTVAGVIYQPGAFTAVDDGQITLTPNQTALNAAQDALNGWDPTGGCIYYWNPKTATSSWIWNLKTVIVIGKHHFAKGGY